MVATDASESLYAVRWLFRIFPFRKLYLIPQVFSASHIPQNTRGRHPHSAIRIPQSILALQILAYFFTLNVSTKIFYLQRGPGAIKGSPNYVKNNKI